MDFERSDKGKIKFSKELHYVFDKEARPNPCRPRVRQLCADVVRFVNPLARPECRLYLVPFPNVFGNQPVVRLIFARPAERMTANLYFELLLSAKVFPCDIKIG